VNGDDDPGRQSPAGSDPSQASPPGSGAHGQPELRGHSHVGSWALGLIVIIIGIIFLGRNAGWFGSWDFDNWWALFILIPAFGSFAGAWRSYNANARRLSGDAARGFMVGLFLLAVTVILLLQLDWGKVWPVLLVVVGIGLLLGWKRR
jgi:hypothetical protein